MGIFTTTADTYANGFYGPQNAAYNNTGWQVDPNLMTPSFAAPYRPEYGGMGPYQPTGNPGFFASVGRLANPFYTPPLYQTPGQAASPYMENATYRPADAFMSGMQSYVVPGLAMGAAMRLMGPNTGSIMGDMAGAFTGKGAAGAMGRGLGQGLTRGMIRGTGLAGQGGAQMYASIQAYSQAGLARAAQHQSMMAAQAARTGFGSGMVNMAERAGFRMTSMAKGMHAAYSAGGIAGATSLAAQGMVGAAGSVIGSFALPLLAAEGVSTLADKTMFEPYVNNRRVARDLRENFSGVTFADAEGNHARGGRGLGQVESTRIAEQITRSGMRDFVFNSDEYTEIASMSARAGLLDNTKAGDISKKVKSIADQIKLIVQISQDPSIQNAIEELSKLQLGGASLTGGRGSQGASAYSQIGMSASAAGTTAKRLMERVGAQGQLLYQMNGMTPYMGQMAAANVYAGFASGSRTGLISEAQMARMGGLEGATQSAMTGAINAMQTPYARMSMYNQYVAGMGGGPGQSVAGVVGGFGRAIGGNPVEAMGTQLLFGNQMAGRALQENGLGGIEQNAIAMLQTMGQQPGRDGKYTAAQLAMALQMNGMSQTEIQAFMTQRASETDPASLQQRLNGYSAQTFEQLRGHLDNEGLLNTPMSRMSHWFGEQWRGLKEGVAGSTALPFQRGTAWAGEKIEQGWDALWYGNSVQKGDELTADQLFGRLDEQYEKAGYRKLSEAEASTAKVEKRRSDEDVYLADFKGFSTDAIGLPKAGGDPYKRYNTKGSVSVDDSRGVAGTIEKIARDVSHPGNAKAREFMRSKDPATRKRLLRELTKAHAKDFKEGTYDKLFVSGLDSSTGLDNAGQFLSDVSGAQTQNVYQKLGRNDMAKFATSLDKVLGQNDFDSYDDLRMIGKVGKLGQMHLAGDLDSGNIDDTIENDAELKKLFGGRRGNDAMDYLTQTLKGSMAEGRLMTGEAALKVGSIDDHVKSRGSRIMDPAIRRRFQDALAKKDRAGMGRALSEYAIKSIGGLDKDMKVAVPSGNLAKTAEAAQGLREGVTAAARDVTSSMTSNVDYQKTFLDVAKSFDKPIENFGSSVAKFEQAVQRLVGGQGGGPALMPQMPGSPYGSNRRELNP